MTAADLQSVAAQASQETQLFEGLTAQAHLLGHMARQETYGLPACDVHLIQKLRNMDPDLRATITNKDTP